MTGGHMGQVLCEGKAIVCEVNVTDYTSPQNPCHSKFGGSKPSQQKTPLHSNTNIWGATHWQPFHISLISQFQIFVRAQPHSICDNRLNSLALHSNWMSLDIHWKTEKSQMRSDQLVFEVTPKCLFLIWGISGCNRSRNISTALVISYRRSPVEAHLHVKSTPALWGSGPCCPLSTVNVSLACVQLAAAELLRHEPLQAQRVFQKPEIEKKMEGKQ